MWGPKNTQAVANNTANHHVGLKTSAEGGGLLDNAAWTSSSSSSSEPGYTQLMYLIANTRTEG